MWTEPHGHGNLASSQQIRTLRLLLVYERESALTLAVGAGIEQSSRVLSAILSLALIAILTTYFWLSLAGQEPPAVTTSLRLTPHDALFGIAMPDSQHGWIVGRYGLVLHTEDGGKTWDQQQTGTAKALTGVSFVDRTHGFCVGSGGTILVTADGGRSWTPQESGVAEQLLGVQALSPTVAWVVGAYGTLLSTNDGGVHWVKHALSWDRLIAEEGSEASYLEPNLNAVFFLNPALGWVVGEFGLILHTTDGGETWTADRYGVQLPQLYAIVVQENGKGWALGQKATFLRTAGLGKHWEEIDLGVKRDLYALTLESTLGLVVGNGIALATSDGGATWKPVVPFPEDLWFASVATRGPDALAVGAAGAIWTIELPKSAGRAQAASGVLR